MKEFIEQLKLYKEYVLITVGIVAGSLFLVSYFATKEALASSENAMSRLIDERECLLNNRIAITEVSAALANLEKERLEKTRMKIDITYRQQAKMSPVDKLYNKELLEQLAKDFQRIDEEIKANRLTARVVGDNLKNGGCTRLREAKK